MKHTQRENSEVVSRRTIDNNDGDHELPIYLDHNASTPILPAVLDAMLPFLKDHFGNASSTHVYGTTMLAAVDEARSRVASLIECAPEEVFFTSGGTEANNLAIRGVAAAISERRQIVTSIIEHPATEGPCALLERHGYRVFRAPVDTDGLKLLADLGESLRVGAKTLTRWRDAGVDRLPADELVEHRHVVELLDDGSQLHVHEVTVPPELDDLAREVASRSNAVAKRGEHDVVRVRRNDFGTGLTANPSAIQWHVFRPHAVEPELAKLGLRPSDDTFVTFGPHAPRPDLGRQRLDNIHGKIVQERAFTQ